MQIALKIKNKNTAYSPLLKPRVNDVVTYNGNQYVNLSGINAAIIDPTNWFKLPALPSDKEINKTAANIDGTDPNFYINLTADGLPPFPKAITVYVDILGDGNFEMITTSYNPITRNLSGMSSPVDYANQLVKIIVS